MKSRKTRKKPYTTEEVVAAALRDPRIVRGLRFMDDKDEYSRCLGEHMKCLSESFAGIRDRGHLYHAPGCEIRKGGFRIVCSCDLAHNVGSLEASINGLYLLLERLFSD